jgi:site-specific recombinase XerD
MHIQQALETYLDAKSHHLRPKTLSEKKRMLGYFATFCSTQNITLEEVRPSTINAYLDHLAATHHSKKGGAFSTHTVFLHVATLKIFLNWASNEEDLEQFVTPVTVRKISNPRRDTLIKDVFSKAHILALLEACQSSERGNEKLNAYLHARDRIIILLLLDTGIRAGELCGLKMNQVFLDKEDPYIRVWGQKTRSWREVGIGTKTLKELEQFINKYRKKEKGSDTFLIRSWRNQPIDVSTLTAIIARLGKAAKIADVRCSPHTFRHTYATWSARAGADVFKISRLLGHQSVRVTENYLRQFSSRDARQGAINPANLV